MYIHLTMWKYWLLSIKEDRIFPEFTVSIELIVSKNGLHNLCAHGRNPEEKSSWLIIFLILAVLVGKSVQPFVTPNQRFLLYSCHLTVRFFVRLIQQVMMHLAGDDDSTALSRGKVLMGKES